MTDDDTDLHDDVTIRPLNDIVPYGENPKEHPQEQVDKIASSIQRFGWDQPIVVDGDGTIIKGHGRYQAAQKLGIEQAPVIEQVQLSETEARAARLADNRVAESSWDIDLLGMELELLDESSLDTELTGFDEDEIEAFGVDSGGAPDPQEEWEDAGMADFENEDALADITLKINFPDEQAVERFNELVGETVTPDTTSIWFPEQEQRQDSTKGWVNDES